MTDVIDPVEVMARALCDEFAPTKRHETYAEMEDEDREYFRVRIRAALTAAEAAGMVWVKRDVLEEAERTLEEAREALRPFAEASAGLDHTLSRYTSIFLGDPNSRYYKPEWETVFVNLEAFANAEALLSAARPSLTGPEQATRDGDATNG